MPHIILFFACVFLAIALGTVLVWVLQWAWACLLWAFQAVIKPFFMFLAPAFLVLSVTLGVLLGIAVAANNYILSIRNNVNPEGRWKSLLRGYLLTSQTALLSIACLAIAGFSTYYIFGAGEKFVLYVMYYYDQIIFPAFEIRFPFWE
jgi:hypothetical protein